jgi:arabinan endo-1,5-alpha-L-arabinosidase
VTSTLLRTSSARRAVGAAAGLVAIVGLVSAPGVAGAAQNAGTYTNPVSKNFADTYADPSLIKGKDGHWYAVATSDPLREGERTPHQLPISRSDDLVNWTFVKDTFNASNRPTWVTDTSGLWAGDIRYLDGRYLMYFTATDTKLNDDPGDSAIGVATAPTPTGPWTDSGGPIVGPRPAPGGGFLWTFDPSEFTAVGGQRYLTYGSYFGGVFATHLTEDGMHTVGDPTMIAIDNRYEGSYLVRHAGWYYFFGSSANCCAGPTTGYSVYTGRARSPLGPFRDRQGVSLLASRVGGTPVIMPNGNTWVGPGHNAVATDASGQDWLAYHAIDRRDPYLDEPFGINERPMLLDRLDWIGGWPTARAGRWASEGPQVAPRASGQVDDAFNRARLGSDYQANGGSWRITHELEGGFVRQQSPGPGAARLLSRAWVPTSSRVEADIRVGSARSAGIVTHWRGQGDHTDVVLDRVAQRLVVTSTRAGRTRTASAPLPANFRYETWHVVSAQVRGGWLIADVTEARLNDPYAVVQVHVPSVGLGHVGVVTRGGSADADNLSAARIFRGDRRAAPTPRRGTLAPRYSDEFTGSIEPAWWWRRKDDAAHVEDGHLVWPTEAKDLTGDSNNAGILLRRMPAGDYTVETKLTIDLGTETVRNFEQGGIIAYDGDNQFARLSHVAIWNTRVTEFGHEMPFADGLSYGGMLIGPPADTTWLRLVHHVDPNNGEHEFRAATSRDGSHWVWGGTWTLPAGRTPRIGLISHGGDNPPATARFDYVRVYR